MASYGAVLTLAIVLCVAAVHAGHHTGYASAPAAYGHEEYAHHKPHYEFKYEVHDSHTGDIKDQWEQRDGDVVKGSYSVAEPDGTLRHVEYHSDGHGGFNAVVKRTGKAIHPHGHSHANQNLH